MIFLVVKQKILSVSVANICFDVKYEEKVVMTVYAIAVGILVVLPSFLL